MLRTPTILVSDDEPMLVNALRREARRLGIDVLVDTHSDVVAMAREHHPDLIVLDVHQRTDGRDLLADLKRDPSTKDVPVIMLSANEDQFLRHTCFELGAIDYELKPFDPTFLRKVARLVHDEPKPDDPTTLH
ncbi:MAG: response regulator [Myxococcaceae bacterium]|jgi:two-component system response regulator AdeR|nr:response regulator [Myxococcaceae bacterium]MCA3016133.1 response regulator [Myxococcaceae bacterium]